MTHYTYIIQCADGTLYTGITTNLAKRIDKHNGHIPGGAKYTRARRPVKLIYHESHPTRTIAAQREYAIKQLSREAKQQLCQSKN